MAIIAGTLDQLKEGLEEVTGLKRVVEICGKLGHQWRDRVLGPMETFRLFLLQILHGNTSCTHVRQLGGFKFSASAYCEARKRLPVEALQTVLREGGKAVQNLSKGMPLWRGHRVRLVDGSSFSMSDEPELASLFGYPANQKPGCGFPIAHMLGLFDLLTGALMELIVSPMRTNDALNVPLLEDHYDAGDILVADRAFCSYGHIALLQRRDAHVVFRLRKTVNVNFKPRRPFSNPRGGRSQVKGHPRSEWIERLGREDQIVEWLKPKEKPEWMSKEEFAQLPDRIRVRELRVKVRKHGCRTQTITIVTTLLDPARYPKSAIGDLYRMRWQVETNLRHLKSTMGMDVLRSKTVTGVLKEAMMFGIVYNAVRLAMVQAGLAQGVPPDQISFIDVMRWITAGCPGDTLPSFVVNRPRDRLPEPRVKKRRPKPYPFMTKPRREYKALLVK
jgi:hypothetical protein